ncbi:hypothetical protein [Candidatus Uabimicrobium amorphum]|uniref:Uncharacterized protein n=1 Tax=Uabimicrobium amorphum TaxID=2596890 RepID=A0A5S9IPY2_UABAM|nr:hypothetical protein [Candidatus Uabimicrobium amorphum]BBM85909.1 hypothetical protein UABAM_04291 [Candidatus Uabimicrobium amorphum]
MRLFFFCICTFIFSSVIVADNENCTPQQHNGKPHIIVTHIYARDFLYEEKNVDWESEIRALSSVKRVHRRYGTSIFDGARGVGISAEEGISWPDIRGHRVRFLTKKQLNSPVDEIGIIVSFSFLKSRRYLPYDANLHEKDTWENVLLPSKIDLEVDSWHGKSTIPVPVIGVVADEFLPKPYVITCGFLEILRNWRSEFLYMLKNRKNEPLVLPPAQSIYYTLTESQRMWLQDNEKVVEQIEEKLSIPVFVDFWDNGEAIQCRLVIEPEEEISRKKVKEIDEHLRSYTELRDLPEAMVDFIPVWKWENVEFYRKYDADHFAIYLKNNDQNVLQELKKIGLKIIWFRNDTRY